MWWMARTVDMLYVKSLDVIAIVSSILITDNGMSGRIGRATSAGKRRDVMDGPGEIDVRRRRRDDISQRIHGGVTA